MEAILLISLALKIIGVIVCVNKAKELNRSQGGWGFFGFLMPIVAMIWIQFMKPVIVWDKNVSLEAEAEIASSKTEEIINEIEKPQNVKKGINLLVVGAVLGMINSIIAQTSTDIYMGDMYDDPNAVGMSVISSIFGIGLMFFFYYQMSIGKKWARTTVLVFFILGLLMLPFSIHITFKANVLTGIGAIVVTLIQVVGLFYLFREDSNRWYNSNLLQSD